MNAHELRHFIYDHIVAQGMPPRLETIAERAGTSLDEARSTVADFRIGKTVLPHPRTGEIWMAGPFASEETPYKIVGSRTWYANCAWDALGIPIIVNEAVRIETGCAHCDDDISFDAFPDRAPDLDAIVHFLVPARRWYDDIGFT